jgi:hypothetical protein
MMDLGLRHKRIQRALLKVPEPPALLARADEVIE